MQSQTKHEMFKVLDKYPKYYLKAAPDKSNFFLTRVKLLGHIIEGNTITPLKSRIDAIINFTFHQIKRKTKKFLECLTF